MSSRDVGNFGVATRGVAVHGLYGPHGLSTGICGGVIARGTQGHFPDHFCLKTPCRFSSHAAKSYLGRLVEGAYYVKENEAHWYAELRLSPEAASLAPGGLLESRNNVGGWKAIIRQLEDQWMAGEVESAVVVAQGAGLTGFAERFLKTPYATTPMRSGRR